MKKQYRVIIVGASSGIGRALAEALASRGVSVGIAARKTDALEKLKEKYPNTILYETIDVTAKDAPGKLNTLIDRMGGMDIYIHAAGIGYSNPGMETELETRTLETNTVGFARMLSTAYRYLRNQGRGGQIAAITSVAGTNGIGTMASYSASKRFQSAYMVALEQLNRKQNAGIYFTDLRPGWVRTPLLEADKKYPMEVDVDYVVPLILKAIIRRKRVAYIDWRWGIAAGLWRLLPDAVWTRLTLDFGI